MVSSFILAICHSFRRMSSSTSPFPTTVNFVWQKKRSGIVTVLFLVDNDDIDYQDKLSHYPVPKPIECCMEKEEELTRDCAIPSCPNWRCHKQWNQADQDELKHFPVPKHSAIHMEKEEEWESICAIPPHHCLLPQMAKPRGWAWTILRSWAQWILYGKRGGVGYYLCYFSLIKVVLMPWRYVLYLLCCFFFDCCQCYLVEFQMTAVHKYGTSYTNTKTNTTTHNPPSSIETFTNGNQPNEIATSTYPRTTWLCIWSLESKMNRHSLYESTFSMINQKLASFLWQLLTSKPSSVNCSTRP